MTHRTERAPCNDPRCTHDHDQLVYATRSNAGIKAERMLGRQTNVPNDYGDDLRRIYHMPRGGGIAKVVRR